MHSRRKKLLIFEFDLCNNYIGNVGISPLISLHKFKLTERNLKLMSKEDSEILLNALLPFANNMLQKYSEFYLMGCVLTTKGEVNLTGTFDGNENPDSKSVIDQLSKTHKELAERKEIKASVIVWNASLKNAQGKHDTDSVVMSIEHADGDSVKIYEPYKIGLFKKVKFGKLFAQEGKHDIF